MVIPVTFVKSPFGPVVANRCNHYHSAPPTHQFCDPRGAWMNPEVRPSGGAASRPHPTGAGASPAGVGRSPESTALLLIAGVRREQLVEWWSRPAVRIGAALVVALIALALYRFVPLLRGWIS